MELSVAAESLNPFKSNLTRLIDGSVYGQSCSKTPEAGRYFLGLLV